VSGADGMSFDKSTIQSEDNRRQAYIKGLEKAIGDEFDIDVQDLRGISSSDQLTAYLAKYADKTAYGKYKEMTAGAVSEDTLATLFNYNPASASGTALARTGLGGFMRNNYYTNAVMTGSEDPEEVNKAVKALGEAAMSTTGDFANASAALVEAKVAIGDTTSRAYAIAQAAEQRIQSIANYRATTTQGWSGTQGVAWQSSQALMGDPKTQQQGEAAMRQQQLDIQQRIGQTIIAMEEYQIQKRQAAFDQARQIDIAEDSNRRSRLRAYQDFARSMKRAAEDFSKNMFDPYQRIANRGVMSLDFILSNGKQQVAAVAQQNKDIAAMRKMGLSQAAIEGQGFNDPANAYQTSFSRQQLARSPEQIAALNKVWADKGAQGADLMEEQTGYQNQQEDFMRQMNRSAFDFAVQMKLSAEAFDIATARSEKAANRMGREAVGNIGTLWTQALGLANSLGLSNASVMVSLADFFKANPLALNDTGEVPGTPSANVGQTYKDPILGKVKYNVSTTVSSNGSYAADWYAKNNDGEMVKLPKDFWYWTDQQKLNWMNGKGPKTGSNTTTSTTMPASKRPSKTVSYQGNGETSWADIQAGQDAAESAFGPSTSPWDSPTTRSSVSKGTQRSLATSGYSKGVTYKGGNTVITNSTHFTVQGDIRADDPEKLGRELKKRERNDNRRKGAQARVSA
jgi:hypothetical protein